jgi:predicted DNA-binding transcriptional regulator AlpA
MSRALQIAKIREIGLALRASGYLELNNQAEALGLCRSTTWAVLQANHKHSGLSASVIHRMLRSQRLPRSVRAKVLEYVEQKLAGRYGHNVKQLANFSRRLDALQSRLSHQLPGDRVGRVATGREAEGG